MARFESESAMERITATLRNEKRKRFEELEANLSSNQSSSQNLLVWLRTVRDGYFSDSARFGAFLSNAKERAENAKDGLTLNDLSSVCAFWVWRAPTIGMRW